MSTVQLPSDGPSPTTLAAPAGPEVPAATQPAASEIGSQVDDAEHAIRPANRRATVGSTAVDEAKRVAIEAMNRVGAMQSTSSGHGYYECVSPQCPAKCRIKKEQNGQYATTWSVAHKQGCNQIGQQPARIQETARKTVLGLAVSKGRKEIQSDAAARALTGRAFGGRRLDKMIEKARSNIPEQLNSKEGLAAYVATMSHKAVTQNEVMVGFRAWDPLIPASATQSDPIYIAHHPDDWDVNAPIPDAPADEELTNLIEQTADDARGDEGQLAEDNGDDDSSEDQEGGVAVKVEGEEKAPKPKPSGPHSVSVFTCRSAFVSMLHSATAMRHIDGTFDVAPTFSCLQNIGYTQKKVYYPVSYVLAKSPGTKSYESCAHVLAVFEILGEMAEELFGPAGVTAWKMFDGQWMRDGGKGYNKAIREYFPNCKQRMCFFHMMQAIWRRKKCFRRVYVVIRDALRTLHLCSDQAEFALGMGTLLDEMSKSRDGRTFVRYWHNTQFGIGCADGNWSISYAGEVTTNNALESFNWRLAEMVFGHGRSRRSAMWCIDRYIIAMSKVLELQDTQIEGHPDSTMWTEWRDVADRAAVNKAVKLGEGLRPSMLGTHCVGESHKMLPLGVCVSAKLYARLAGERAKSLKHWSAWMSIRHVTDHGCTCWTFCQHAVCKHVCALRVGGDLEITPVRAVPVVDTGAPRKSARDAPSHLSARLQELDVNRAKRVRVSQEK